MLENWIWVPKVLKELGRHYSYLSESYRELSEKSRADSTGHHGDVVAEVEEFMPDPLID